MIQSLCRLLPFIAAFAFVGVVSAAEKSSPLGAIAESYVKLALAAGVHDGDFVDAYHGPAAWRETAVAAKEPLARIKGRTTALRQELAATPPPADEMGRLRHVYLTKQLQAMETRVDLLLGQKRKFDDESRLLFDAVAPTRDAAHYDKVLAELERALPGTGPLTGRYAEFRRQFIIPPEKLDAVFKAAVAASRERTLRHIPLPAGESFTIEYVKGKSWSGYNWYKGDYHSLIQVNTDLPVFIDRAVDLAAHEGYPGHHVYNVLLEKNLLRDRGWIEFSLYALFSPQSLIAEGSANHGIDVAFPGAERLKFEREVLFPLAGLDPARVDEYYRVQRMTKELAFAGNEAARRYLDGAIGAEEAVDWLTRYVLMEPARAQQRVRFIDQYRTYVINYNYGLKLVADYIEQRAEGDPEKRWKEFEALISSPRLPADLK